MPKLVHNRVPARFVEEYLEILAKSQSFQTSNVRHWTLLKCYAELQYKLNGGSKCPVCRAHVRHVIPVTIERLDGTTDTFHCLCTRCFEGERAVSKVSTIQMGEARIDYHPHEYGARTQRVEAPATPEAQDTKAAAQAAAQGASTSDPGSRPAGKHAGKQTAHPMPTPPPV